MLKNNIINALTSFLTLFVLSVIFILSGYFILDAFDSFASVVMIGDFCILLCAGYIIGRKLHYAKYISLISIVMLPLLMIAVLYGIGLLDVPVIRLLQYPSAVWLEGFGLRLGSSFVGGDTLYNLVSVAHYLISSFSLFAGAYINHRKQDDIAVEQ